MEFSLQKDICANKDELSFKASCHIRAVHMNQCHERFHVSISQSIRSTVLSPSSGYRDASTWDLIFGLVINKYVN